MWQTARRPARRLATSLTAFLAANSTAAKPDVAPLRDGVRLAVADTNSASIFENLAAEESLMRGLALDKDQCLILFYVNRPCVVVGRNQNIFQEVSLRRARSDKVAVARRASGGGTVFHDAGNLCLSFLTHRARYAPEVTVQLLRMALSVCCGVAPARLTTTGRHDLFLDGKKITGSAMRVQRDIAYHHCTLLVNSPPAALGRYLHPEGEYAAFKTTSVGSVRSPVTTLCEAQCIPAAPHAVETLKADLADFFLAQGTAVLDAAAPTELSVAELQRAFAAARPRVAARELVYVLDVVDAVQTDAPFVEGAGRRPLASDPATLGEAVRRSASPEWANAMPPFTSTVCITAAEVQGRLAALPGWADVVRLSSLTEAELASELHAFLFDGEAEEVSEGLATSAELFVRTTVEQGSITAVAVTRGVSEAATAVPWLQRYLAALLVGRLCDAAVEGLEGLGGTAAVVQGLAHEAGPRCPDMPDLARDAALLMVARVLLQVWRHKNVFDVALMPL